MSGLTRLQPLGVAQERVSVSGGADPPSVRNGNGRGMHLSVVRTLNVFSTYKSSTWVRPKAPVDGAASRPDSCPQRTFSSVGLTRNPPKIRAVFCRFWLSQCLPSNLLLVVASRVDIKTKNVKTFSRNRGTRRFDPKRNIAF